MVRLRAAIQKAIELDDSVAEATHQRDCFSITIFDLPRLKRSFGKRSL